MAETSAREVDGLGLDALAAGVEAGDLHQVLDQPPQAPDVRDQELGGPPGLDRHRLEMLGEERGLADERRQRRAQLVGDVGGEAALAGLGGGEGRDLRLERRRHLVEGLRPDPELVTPLDGKPRLEQSLGERARRLACARDGSQRAAREERADEGCDQHQDPDPDEQDVPELYELVAEVLLREEEVELGVAAGRPADDEVVRARHRLARVAELAVPDELPQSGRHLPDADREARLERAATVDPDRLEIPATAGRPCAARPGRPAGGTPARWRGSGGPG